MSHGGGGLSQWMTLRGLGQQIQGGLGRPLGRELGEDWDTGS